MKIEYYSSLTSSEPVAKFLKKLPDRKHALEILDDIELLKEFSIGQLSASGNIEKIKRNTEGHLGAENAVSR